MYRSFIGDENSSGEQPLSSQAVQGLPSAGLASQESSWISVVCRPPLSFLHKYVRGRTRTPSQWDDWLNAMKTSFLCDENAFLRQMEDMIPATHAASSSTQLQGLFTGTAAAANTLLFQGVEELEAEVCQDQRTQRSPSRTFFRRVWSTSPDMNLAALRTWVPESPGGGAQWWSSFWGGSGASAQGLLSEVSRVQDRNLTGPHSKTKAPAVFIQSKWILGESAGPTSYKGEAFNTGALQTVQNMEGPTANLRHSGSAPGSVALDQDNGYSSLEEELLQVSCLHMLAETFLSPCEAGGPTVKSSQEQEDSSEDADALMGEQDENTRLDKGEHDPFALPPCQNRAIAFIMGCPCSDDDDDSQSEGETSDDDDGFDSKGSSSLSESSGDDESSDSEVDLDSDRLWSSLCPSTDPYNPQNFMAQLQTRTAPQTSSVPSPPQSDPTSVSCIASLPASQPPSDSWDDSASESEADEAERLRLWTSFSSCLDPYSPLNFQATLRTREPGQAGTWSRSGTREASRAHTSPSREEEPAESLDRDFREASRRSIKKVSERTCFLHFTSAASAFQSLFSSSTHLG